MKMIDDFDVLYDYSSALQLNNSSTGWLARVDACYDHVLFYG